MAGYNPNDNKNEYFGNEYINFDQFLMQHNIGNANAPQVFNPFIAPDFSSYYSAYNGLYPQPTALNDEYYNSDLAQNSNLVPTATEFIPNFPAPLLPSQPLLANATEFIPQNISYAETNRTNDVYDSNAPPDSSGRNDFFFPPDDQSHNNNRAMPELKYDESSKSETLLNAMRTTSIGNSSSSSSSLTKAGGAIKKVKDSNQTNSTRERNGNRNNRNNIGNNLLLENISNSDRLNDRKRDIRKNDNRRYGGTGRTASQYDSNERFNNKNEYASARSREKQNRWNNNGNQNTNNETASNKQQQLTSKAKDRKFGESVTRKNEDFKLNRHLKSQNFKFENIQFDSANCSQREKLIREIDSGRLECLVCCEMIKPFSSIWSCSNCYHIIHLSCVIKWATSSKSEEGWRCCACQNITKKIPHEYYCFCGKLKNPQYNRNDVAHSCGNCCGKTDGCPHPCTQLCHPGPCPPCQATVTRTCGCGRSEKTMQCCQKDGLECEHQCDKVLNCSVHKCTKTCHTGACTDCDQETKHTCYCSRETKILSCTQENNESLYYSCAKQCNKQLNCKEHKCKQLCHPGDCNDCEFLPSAVKTCPCGKMSIAEGERNSCKDPIPLCAGNCKKPLSCGQPAHPHTCQSKCHIGACPSCSKQTSVKCRCGHMDQMIKCSELLTRADDARCKKRCVKKRNCGKHKCNQDCCIDIDHVCPLPCNYNLNCRKHFCEQTCHKGRCLPCLRSSFDELRCECGASVIYPPVACGTKKPICEKPCSRQHPCDHPVVHNCHSAQNCPPCMAFTTKYCHGKHEQRKIIPCSQTDFSCGLSCNKPLKCGQHKCIKICHAGPCEVESDVCKQNCTKPRVMCPHNCNAPCHLNTPCPDIPCRENVEVLCQCGLRKQIRTCYDFSSDYRKIATSKLASTMAQMQSGSAVELSDVLGPIKTSNNKTLECTEECRVQERNRRLAIGLQIRNPDLPSKLQPKYSEFIRGWGKKDPKLVSMIHDKLTELVKLAKDSKQKSRSYSFPTMNREKRQLVHEMSAMFGVESVAYDAEPNRNIVATATRDASWLPGMGVMEMMQRESGQRRIPIPSMNAWGIKR